MPSSLDWTVGPAGAETPVEGPFPLPPRSRRRSLGRQAVLATFYAVALTLAAALGYQLGRWRHARDLNLESIVNQLAVEDLAWAEGDRALYASTLDTAMAGERRNRLVDGFSLEAPSNVRHRLLRVSFQPPDRAVATVGVDPSERGPAAGQGMAEEVRAYRLVGRSWLRTDDP